jgi:hypothetical protein
MSKTKKAEFAMRPAGPIPVVGGSRAKGKRHRTEIESQDSVTLYIGSERVLVKEVEVLGNGKYWGRIDAFEPSHAQDYEGHKLEDSVDFEDFHVHALVLPRS